jgi:AbrB family looped-hinge helix DNA binding protein
MVTARVTSKGQITIPKAVRERLGLHSGDEVQFFEKDGAMFIRKEIRESPFRKYRGYLKHLAGRDSDELVEEMRGR